jgi:membrane-associated phospholipid phosphatase
MTPRPRRYLFLALLGTCLFALVAFLVKPQGALDRFDGWVSDGSFRFTIARPKLHDTFNAITHLGDGWFLTGVGAVSAAVLLVRREWFRAVVWAAGGLALWAMVPLLKGAFERKRPDFADQETFSFPSGHAFGSAVVYGLMAILALRVWHGSRWRWVIAGGLALLILLIGLSRILLGKHYLTDVIAGWSLGLGWAFWCAALADWWDLRRIRGSAKRVEQTQDPA